MQGNDAQRVADTDRLCSEVASAAQQAITWLSRDANKARAGQRFDDHLRELRKTARVAQRLKSAAASPVSVAVYGASQAGKSFLVAHLGAPPRGTGGTGERAARVLPHLDRDGKSFLDINPTGGRESTGLVTRFTTRPISADATFPVLLRLLTALDLVKILTSCFCSDMDLKEEAPRDTAAVEAAIREAGQRAHNAPRSITSDDVYELRDYCRQWSHTNNIKTLDDVQYWERAAAVVDGLDGDGMTRLFSVLWNEIPVFSRLFGKLYDALQRLGFAAEVHCRIDALLPRMDASNRPMTIIDVDTLKRLMSGEAEPLEVRHPGGVATLDRPVVTALAAELVLNLHGETRPFLRQIDLLDFPGARSRGGTRRAILDEAGQPESVFLRGKVALLFDRYRDEYDLTSMILCVGPSAQEVKTLPQLVNEWVEATHGKTPHERSQRSDTALFLVLTMFDRQFQRQIGDEEALPDKWTNRINASISGFLGASGTWTREWHPGRAFNNVFWYRNPFVDQSHLVTYDAEQEPRSETGQTSDPAAFKRIEDMRKAYFEVDLVHQHFSDPEQAWSAALKLNDGGISYLSDRVATVASHGVKIDQIRARAIKLAAETRTQLQPYFFDNDPNQQLRTRLAHASRLIEELGGCADRGLFGHMLAMLQVEPAEIAQVMRSVRLREQGRRIGGSAGSLAAEVLGQAGAQQAGDLKIIDCSDPSSSRLSMAERFACRAVGRWVERVDQTCKDPEALAYFGLTQESAQTLASELAAASRRTNLASIVAERLRPVVGFEDNSADFGLPTPALTAAAAINQFVNALDIKPRAQAKPRIRRAAEAPKLGPEPRNTAREFCRDWLTSYIDVVRKNAESPEGQSFNVAENDALGKILERLASCGTQA